MAINDINISIHMNVTAAIFAIFGEGIIIIIIKKKNRMTAVGVSLSLSQILQ